MNFKDIRESFRNKEISAKELTQDSLGKAKKFSNLNAFISTFDEDALKKAEHIDNNFNDYKDLALGGVPIAHKDIFAQKESVQPAHLKCWKILLRPTNQP